jgi:uncharacterized protein YndB with AHSA1/START domain
MTRAHAARPLPREDSELFVRGDSVDPRCRLKDGACVYRVARRMRVQRQLPGNASKGEAIMSTNTVRLLHRVLRTTPEKDLSGIPRSRRHGQWLPPNGFTGKVHHIDAKVGGDYKMSFTNFTTGHSHSFGGKYLELVPHERIRHNGQVPDDPNLPGEMQNDNIPEEGVYGTEVNIVQEGIPRPSHPRRAISAGKNR